MHLKNLQLNQFKNYKQAKLELSSEINCFVGINGSGKTNLLDAIHYLCLTKSALNAQDSQNILHDQEFFTVFGEFNLDFKTLEIRCVVESGKKKQLIQNGKSIEKMSEHIGLLPVVMIAPDDTLLIKDGSEERRRFFDNMLCQLDKTYLESLVRYQHFLKQRNALLKQFADTNRVNKPLLEPFDREIIQLSIQIAKAREQFLEEYKPLLLDHYADISGQQEDISIQYDSDCLVADFEGNFLQNQPKDLILKRTTMGIHKDDFIFEIDNYPIKKFGSQGQQKSFVIALKLAQFEIFFAHKETKPILLLDDIFDKLDDLRIEKLMKLVANHKFGQLFITDARPERSKSILQEIDSNAKFFMVDSGVVSVWDQ
ncbi:DNA replication and repair protein RecF [Belliella baltica DSM 15883]|uniref:DNA replication and repair protein RecF n=1 Tax=Belliella baltica (strain DSM 15883 / CIP 108006 / LMG 21964 / BA134) TaxID=866536 RepID=I3Z3H2_BELBD|nr:DNA replication/repair protein RecF [Belliella baltica]AFL83790.1 DNA replication and repair protein RecF [Belliella baltica DSM 15883]